MGRQLLAAGETAAGATTFQQAIDRDPYLEAAHRGLLRCFDRLGEAAQADRHYASLVAFLEEELGTPPTAATTALYRALRSAQSPP